MLPKAYTSDMTTSKEDRYAQDKRIKFNVDAGTIRMKWRR